MSHIVSICCAFPLTDFYGQVSTPAEDELAARALVKMRHSAAHPSVGRWMTRPSTTTLWLTRMGNTQRASVTIHRMNCATCSVPTFSRGVVALSCHTQYRIQSASQRSIHNISKVELKIAGVSCPARTNRKASDEITFSFGPRVMRLLQPHPQPAVPCKLQITDDASNRYVAHVVIRKPRNRQST